MVAHAANKSEASYRGIRPFSAREDLYGVARLLEEAFRPEHSFPFSNVPLMREMGIALWVLNYAPTFPDTLEGFVWIENGQVIGNASLTPDLIRGNRYYISNVAVKPEFRRKGIARELMQASIEHIRRQNVKSVLLNVRPKNEGAIKLYQGLGFKELEMRGEWTFSGYPQELRETSNVDYRPLRWSDMNAVSELIRAATPPNVKPFHSRPNAFEPGWDVQLVELAGNLLGVQTTRRWIFERDGRAAALLLVEGKNLGTPHHLIVEAHPDFHGQVEDELITAAWQALLKYPVREIRAEATSLYPEFISALERRGFRFLNGMTLMELDFS